MATRDAFVQGARLQSPKGGVFTVLATPKRTDSAVTTRSEHPQLSGYPRNSAIALPLRFLVTWVVIPPDVPLVF